MAACSSALTALSFSSQAHDVDIQVREEYLSKEKLAVSPVPPKPDMVLPSVHIVWTPLCAALRDSRIAVREGAMNALIEITRAGGGDFLSRRFRDDIWPILLHELGGHLMVQKSLKILNHEESTAPNVIIRSRASALECVWALAEDQNTRKVFRSFVRQLVEIIVPFIGKSQAVQIREYASKALLSLAKVDADVVWLYLTDIKSDFRGRDNQMCSPKPKTLPGMNAALSSISSGAMGAQHPHVHLASNAPDPKKVFLDCGDRAKALLEKVGTVEVAWHKLVMNRLCD